MRFSIYLHAVLEKAHLSIHGDTTSRELNLSIIYKSFYCWNIKPSSFRRMVKCLLTEVGKYDYLPTYMHAYIKTPCGYKYELVLSCVGVSIRKSSMRTARQTADSFSADAHFLFAKNRKALHRKCGHNHTWAYCKGVTKSVCVCFPGYPSLSWPTGAQEETSSSDLPTDEHRFTFTHAHTHHGVLRAKSF